MSTPVTKTQRAGDAADLIATLEREIAELRRQLAVSSNVAEISRLHPQLINDVDGAEAQYRALIESTPLAVWITDINGRALYGNRYWIEFTGMTMEQASGWGWIKALHPDDAARLKADWDAGRRTAA